MIFTLGCVPMVGALAPIADLVSVGDFVFVDAGDNGVWGGVITDRPAASGWCWLDGAVWFLTPRSRVDTVNLRKSSAARSAVVAWLASQGHTDAGTSDAALLSALRAVCGLLPAPPAVDSTDTDDIPF